MSEKTIRVLDREITRRDALKAGGVAGVGLAFAAPVMRSIKPLRAFAKDYEDPCTGVTPCDIGENRPHEILFGTVSAGPTRTAEKGDQQLYQRGYSPDCGTCSAGDCNPPVVTAQWEIIDGDASKVVILSPTVSQTIVTWNETGEYTLQLTSTATCGVGCCATTETKMSTVVVTVEDGQL